MVRVNENYLKIQSSYLFTEIAHRVKAYQEKNPAAKIIRLGIGDVTEPLPPAVIEAMHTVRFLRIAFLQGWDHLPADFDDVLARARTEVFPRVDELSALVASEF